MTPKQKELIVEGEGLEAALSNGHRGDPNTMSDAIRYLIRTNRIQLHADLISDAECRSRMAHCPGNDAHKRAMGWPAALTTCSGTLGLIWLILRLVGKA